MEFMSRLGRADRVRLPKWDVRCWRFHRRSYVRAVEVQQTLQRLPASKPHIQLVPPFDALFAETPAQVHGAPFALRRKVDQPLVDALQLDAPRVEPLQTLVQLSDARFGSPALLADRFLIADVPVAR